MSVESIKYNDICDDCIHKGYCDMAQFGGHNPHITACSRFIASKQTNGDRIRQMSDEELARFMWNCAQPCCPPINCAFEKCGAEKCWFSWLKATADKEGE